MPENPVKMPRSASPIARAGAGDISERELCRERYKLQTTPPARLQPAHPKKQLFFTPVNKFTASRRGPSPHLEKIRNCLEEYATPVKKAKMAAKAASMEDLTPTNRLKNDKRDGGTMAARPRQLHRVPDEEAAARVARFMVVAAWRKRREDVRCLRRTLEFQVSVSERLRLQVCALKSLLDADNCKVRLAMRELERLKQLLKDKDAEKAVLEREKLALEDDVCVAEDRASEMSIGWRNTRNELECARGALSSLERALALERAAAAEARAQRDHAYERLSLLEEEVSQQEEVVSAAADELAALRQQAAADRAQLDRAEELLRTERDAREACSLECAVLSSRALQSQSEREQLRAQSEQVARQLADTQRQLALTAMQLDWWPAPLTRLVGAARRWLRRPLSAPAAILWSAVPATHGCSHLAGSMLRL